MGPHEAVAQGGRPWGVEPERATPPRSFPRVSREVGDHGTGLGAAGGRTQRIGSVVQRRALGIAQQQHLGVDRVVIQEIIDGAGMGIGGMMGGMGGAGGEDIEEALEEADIDADELAEELGE